MVDGVQRDNNVHSTFDYKIAVGEVVVFVAFPCEGGNNRINPLGL